jgi:hypothetical protein
MRNLGKALRRAAFAMLLAAAASHAQNPNPAPPPDQRSRQCAETSGVGGQTANPFTAKRVTKGTSSYPDGTQKPHEWIEPVARDSEGRIRFERQGFPDHERSQEKVVLTKRDGGTIETTRETLGIVILIFDCRDSMEIQIQPGMQIARVTRGVPLALPNGSNRPFSSRITSLLSGKPQPSVSVEDLGSRVIEGLSARGVRLTSLGTESDGDWKGKPVRITETWASDDLAATILEIHTDPKTHMEETTTLTDIKREEPDHSLFEIPPGYKVNPMPDEMPYRMARPAPTGTNPEK